MPRTRRSGLPSGEELPGTLRRSSKEAQEAFTKAHDWIPKDGPGPATMAG